MSDRNLNPVDILAQLIRARSGKMGAGPLGEAMADALLASGYEIVRGWQPIETAPKNEHILAVVEGQVRCVRYCKTSHLPIVGWCLVDQGAEDCDLCEPTCWMHMPSPPSEVKP